MPLLLKPIFFFFVDAEISADGYSEESIVGAMGGTLRLDAREVQFLLTIFATQLTSGAFVTLYMIPYNVSLYRYILLSLLLEVL